MLSSSRFFVEGLPIPCRVFTTLMITTPAIMARIITAKLGTEIAITVVWFIASFGSENEKDIHLYGISPKITCDDKDLRVARTGLRG